MIVPQPGSALVSAHHRYIMEGEAETDRLRLKTEQVLARRHLDWAGLAPGESFLDLGCGDGMLALLAARCCRPGRLTALDGHPGRIRSVLERAGAHGLVNVDGRVASIAGPGSSGLRDGSYDHAFTRFFLEYQPQPRAVVLEMVRVVRVGGRVTLIDLEGNGVWHHGMGERLKEGLAEVIGDLRGVGFDPHVGRSLMAIATEAGLVDVRHEIEPYHRIVGRPDERTAAAWRLKVENLRTNYLNVLYPAKRHLAWVFDEYMRFLLDGETMTWSLLHLVQGIRP